MGTVARALLLTAGVVLLEIAFWVAVLAVLHYWFRRGPELAAAAADPTDPRVWEVLEEARQITETAAED